MTKWLKLHSHDMLPCEVYNHTERTLQHGYNNHASRYSTVRYDFKCVNGITMLIIAQLHFFSLVHVTRRATNILLVQIVEV